MIAVAHILDDFRMGGVTRALTLFSEPELAREAQSEIVRVSPDARIAPAVRADLIVNHMALSWARLAFLASLKARNPRARIVHVEHGYTRAFEERQIAAKARFRTMLRIGSLLVERIVCVSHAQRDWMAGTVGIDARKLDVIHPWCGRCKLIGIEQLETRRARPMRLLAYGRFCEVKNFAELVKAMRSFGPTEVELRVFGDGPERGHLKLLARAMPHVRILEACDDPSSHLAWSDAVIVPSRNEAFGLVATEARLAARPIIVADVDGLPEQVGNAGFSAPLATASDIARAVRRALSADLARMGAEGRSAAALQERRVLENWESLIARPANERAGMLEPLRGPSVEART